MLAVAGCGGSTPTATTTALPTAGATRSTMASAVHCDSAVPAGDNLVIGTVVGDPTIVVRDIQDPAHAKNLCTFDPSVLAPQFVSGTAVAYETADNQIIKANLAGGETTILATYSSSFD